MRTFTLTLLVFGGFIAQAQTEKPARTYHGIKGFNFYFVFQPFYQDPNELNSALSAGGAPQIRKLATATGGGLEYLFASGTGIRMEITQDNFSRERNNTITRFRPTLVDFGLRQMIRPAQKVRPYVAAAFGARTAELQVIRNTNPGNSFASALGLSNTTTLTSNTAYLAGAIGVNFQSAVGKSTSSADFSELELGYRGRVGGPEWETPFVGAPNLPNEQFRQFYLSLKVGFQGRSRVRNH